MSDKQYAPTYTIETGKTIDPGVQRAMQLASEHFAKAGVTLEVLDKPGHDQLRLSYEKVAHMNPQEYREFTRGANVLQTALEKSGISFDSNLATLSDSRSDNSYILNLRPDAVKSAGRTTT